MPLNPSKLEALILSKLKSEISTVYGEVMSKDAGQRANLEKLATFISKIAVPIITHILSDAKVMTDVKVGPHSPGGAATGTGDGKVT